MDNPMSSALLGEQHHDLSEGVRSLLETTFDTVFVVADAASLVEGAARLRPELVVVDLALARGDLSSLMESLRARAPETRVLFLSMHDEETVAAYVMAAGADGFVLARDVASELLPAIDTLLTGGRHVPHGASV